MRAASPPLQPSGDDGRRLLRDELVHGEYHRHDVVRRLLAWLARRLQDGVGAASGSNGITAFLTMLVAVVLVVVLALLLSRVRRDRRRSADSEAVLTPGGPSAQALRQRAEAALAEGRHEQAVVDGFRALAVRQVERGRLDDQPGSTAHEVALSLATSYPDVGSRVGHGADLFDATLYGARPATREDAAEVLGLDDVLGSSR